MLLLPLCWSLPLRASHPFPVDLIGCRARVGRRRSSRCPRTHRSALTPCPSPGGGGEHLPIAAAVDVVILGVAERLAGPRRLRERAAVPPPRAAGGSRSPRKKLLPPESTVEPLLPLWWAARSQATGGGGGAGRSRPY